MSKEIKYNDSVVNPNFQRLLDGFHEAITNPVDQAIPKIQKLQEDSLNTHVTGRQREAIMDRCNHYLNGTYGNTKTAGQMAYGAAPTK